MAIYDTMQYVQNDVATVGMGLAASMGQYSVIDGSGSTIYSIRDSVLVYYYKDARYYVLSEFTSNNGCYTSFKTDINIDTTQLRFKAMPSNCARE